MTAASARRWLDSREAYKIEDMLGDLYELPRADQVTVIVEMKLMDRELGRRQAVNLALSRVELALFPSVKED